MLTDILYGFISVRAIDIIDILLVALILYQLYLLIKGTVAVNIFIGIFSIFILYRVVKAFEMQLLSDLLGQFISVGMIALIIVFQPEIRDFLFYLGKPRFLQKGKKRTKLLQWFQPLHSIHPEDVDQIVEALSNLSKSKTGALIVVAKQSELTRFVETGALIESKITSRLIENIFFKNSPLHDGAIIIVEDKIKAAAAVLPLTAKTNFPDYLGLRHRAALGISEKTDAIAIVVSEQTGYISVCQNGNLRYNTTPEKLKALLLEELGLNV